MKKFVSICMICLFFLLTISVKPVLAFYDEQLAFYYNEKVFTYNLSKHIKTNTQFDLNYELNKLNRFSCKEDRVILLKKLTDLGFDANISLNYLFPNLDKTINIIEKNLSIKPKNANIKINSNIEPVFKITKETIGVKLDRTTLYNNILSAYLNNKTLNFNIPTIKLNPQITSEFYKKYTNLRSNFSTDISNSSTDRKHNIKNALISLNKTEIFPNAIFSFNKCVGARTTANGYRDAKIIVNDEFVNGVGGGVCQVSSTLYNAALLAGLEIVEANKHSKQVGYVKYGFDAMVNFGSSDLKFKNNTKEKLTIITNYSNNSIKIRIYGEALNGYSYKLINEISNVVEPQEEIIYDINQIHSDKVYYNDEWFYKQTATKGMTIKSYREIFYNNQLINKQLLRTDNYRAKNSIKVFGVNERIPKVTPFDLPDTQNQNS